MRGENHRHSNTARLVLGVVIKYGYRTLRVWGVVVLSLFVAFPVLALAIPWIELGAEELLTPTAIPIVLVIPVLTMLAIGSFYGVILVLDRLELYTFSGRLSRSLFRAQKGALDLTGTRAYLEMLAESMNETRVTFWRPSSNLPRNMQPHIVIQPTSKGKLGVVFKVDGDKLTVIEASIRTDRRELSRRVIDTYIELVLQRYLRSDPRVDSSIDHLFRQALLLEIARNFERKYHEEFFENYAWSAEG